MGENKATPEQLAELEELVCKIMKSFEKSFEKSPRIPSPEDIARVVERAANKAFSHGSELHRWAMAEAERLRKT